MYCIDIDSHLLFIVLFYHFQRQSYEWYIPKGILKSNWISKYLYHVPALVVLFCDLDWNDSSWTEKKNDLASKIQALKWVTVYLGPD